MPKRTKREKLLAQLRRQASTRVQTPSPSEVANNVQPQSTFTYQITKVSPEKEINNATNTEELTIIRGDLVRTIILALCAVAIELIMSVLLKAK